MQRVGLPVFGPILDRNRMGLDRNATFPFQVHGIKDLLLGLSGSHRASCVENPVSEGRFAVIDMGDNRKIAYEALQMLTLFPIKSVHYSYRPPGCQSNGALV